MGQFVDISLVVWGTARYKAGANWWRILMLDSGTLSYFKDSMETMKGLHEQSI